MVRVLQPLKENMPFVRRLTQACDASPVCPPLFGRQKWFADRLPVSREMVSRWFRGISIPPDDMLAKIAETLGVDMIWLRYGDRSTTAAAKGKGKKTIPGEVSLVAGMIQYDGGEVVYPAAGAEDFDFTARVGGHEIPVKVLRPRLYRNQHLVAVPKLSDVPRALVICYVHGKGSPREVHFVDIRPSTLEAIRIGKQESDDFTLRRIRGGKGNLIVSGDVVLPRIGSFANPWWLDAPETPENSR